MGRWRDPRICGLSPIYEMFILPTTWLETYLTFQRAQVESSCLSFHGSQGTDDSSGHHGGDWGLDPNPGFCQNPSWTVLLGLLCQGILWFNTTTTEFVQPTSFPSSDLFILWKMLWAYSTVAPAVSKGLTNIHGEHFSRFQSLWRCRFAIVTPPLPSTWVEIMGYYEPRYPCWLRWNSPLTWLQLLVQGAHSLGSIFMFIYLCWVNKNEKMSCDSS